MARNPKIKVYRPELTQTARDALMKLAARLGFVVTQPGRYYGDPTPPAMLDSLAAAYERDPDAVVDALRQLGVSTATADLSHQ